MAEIAEPQLILEEPDEVLPRPEFFRPSCHDFDGFEGVNPFEQSTHGVMGRSHLEVMQSSMSQ